MQERILDSNILPEPIFQLIKSERFVARKVDGGVFLAPVDEVADTSDLDSLVGIAKGVGVENLNDIKALRLGDRIN